MALSQTQPNPVCMLTERESQALESLKHAMQDSLNEGNKVQLDISKDQLVLEDWGKDVGYLKEIVTLAKESSKGVRFFPCETSLRLRGFGKLSLVRLGERTDLKIKDGESNVRLLMTMGKIQMSRESLGELLSHIGTRIVISGNTELPPLREIKLYLEKHLGLSIAGGSKIVLNGNPLSTDLNGEENFLFKLESGEIVGGNLRRSERAGAEVDVYVRYEYVCSIALPSRKVSGWVNCNALIVGHTGMDLVKNEVYEDFLRHLILVSPTIAE